MGFLFLILYSRAPRPSPSPPAPPVLPLHTLFVHTLFVNTHFVNIHSVTTYFVNTHFVNIHFVNTLCQHTLCHHILCQHTLCQHTLSTHTLSHSLSTYTLSTHSVNTHSVTTYFVNIHFVNTLCQHTLCHHILCQHTLCQYTLSTHTLSTYTSVNTHFVNTLCQHTLCLLTYTHTHKTYFVDTHFVTTHSPSFHVSTHTLSTYTSVNTHFVNTLCQHTLCLLTLTYTHTHKTYFVNTHFTYIHTHTHTRHTLSTHTLSPHIHPRFTWQAWHTTHIYCRFTWQAWHKLASTVVLRGRRGTDGTGWRAWTGLGACDAAALCVAGVAQTHIYCRFTWQAWHKLASTVVLRGRRGTHGTGWRAWTGLGACDAAALCVAGVAQTHIYCRFTWQAWHKLASSVVLRGRRGTHGTGWRAWTGLGACDAAAFCVAGVAQTHIHLRFTWQAWHKLASTVVLRGRRGTHGTGWRAWTGLGACDAAALCVAGVAQTHIYCRFTWQAWHKLASTIVLRGRRGTHGTGWRAWTGLGACDAAALCVAGVAQTHIYCRFTWQAWHKLASTVVLRGRRGTHGTGWRAWTGLGACDAAALCVAGVAQTHIHLRFTWQARTNWHPASFCVAGVGHMALGGALGLAWAPVTPRHFAWQAWHKLTSTYVSRGRRGTNWHPPSFCVAGVAQMALGGALGLAWAPVMFQHV